VSQRITINPITRLEGHGKIEIFLNDGGNVEDVFLQVTELRGFEVFCLGRPVEELPRIMSNVCGVCPTPHNMASTKALDDLYGVEPTPTAKLIRQLHYNAFIVEDHLLHFYILSSPDFVLGPTVDPAQRNIIGVVQKVGLDIGGKVIEVRKRCREIVRHIASKPPHPEGGLPGGVSLSITEEDRKWMRETADLSVEFCQFSLGLFRQVVLDNKDYLSIIQNDAYKLNTYYMALVDDDNRVSFYDGKCRVVNQRGEEHALFDYRDYVDYIGEWVEPWTYIRLTHLRKLGWKGLNDGEATSLYRVGPLARLNVADSMLTPLAQKECETMFAILGGKPSHHTLAYHWARLIEALQAAEHMQRIANDPLLTSKDIRNMDLRLGKVGIGCVEAARGTLIHHYEADVAGRATKVNLIVATQHNAAPVCLSVKKAAKEFVKGSQVREGFLNMVEMAFRAYDPCMACATHALPGRMPLIVNIRDNSGRLIRTIQRP
jgi:F420-non-reducing hydrogenase large subunit